MADEQQAQGVSLEVGTITSTCRKVIEQLSSLRDEVKSIVPTDTRISFHFDDRLHINIDVRDQQDLTRLEASLPSLANGVFKNIRRSLADHHSFRHRLTAEYVE